MRLGRWVAAGVLAAALAGPSTALAQELVQPTTIAEADRNGDGRVTRGEFVAHSVQRVPAGRERGRAAREARRRFDRLDRDRDGIASAAEILISTL